MMDRIALLARRAYALVGEGAEALLRISKEGQLVVIDGGGRYQEAADRGALYSASTAKTGVAPGTDIGTTAAFCLANPWESGVDLVIEEVSIGYVSGTLGAGFIGACVGPVSPTLVTGTAISVVGKGGNTASKGKAFTTATIPAAPTIAQPLWTLGAALASSVAFASAAKIELHGGIVLPPGANFSMQGVAAAGTGPLVVLGCVWREVPRPS